MSGNVIPFRSRPTTEAYFGGCPECGSEGNHANIGRDHWAACPVHKTKWWIGSNLFSSWRNETEADWKRNADELASYRDVEPIYPKLTEEQRKQRAENEAHLARCKSIDRGYGVSCFGGSITALGPTDNPLFGPPDSISDQHEHVARVQLLRPPKSISLKHERLVASMLKHWRAGLLGFLWAQAVRVDCPDATLDEFHDAAGEARPLLAGTP